MGAVMSFSRSEREIAPEKSGGTSPMGGVVPVRRPHHLLHPGPPVSHAGEGICPWIPHRPRGGPRAEAAARCRRSAGVGRRWSRQPRICIQGRRIQNHRKEPNANGILWMRAGNQGAPQSILASGPGTVSACGAFRSPLVIYTAARALACGLKLVLDWHSATRATRTSAAGTPRR